MENLIISTLAARKKTITVLFFIINCIISTDCFAQPSIQWSKIYSPTNMDDEASSICSDGHGHYFISGFSSAPEGLLIKINEYGDSMWTKTIINNGIETIIATEDRGCILTGFSDAIKIMRLDSNGNQVWAFSYGSQEYSEMEDIKRTSDGNYIACGYRFSTGYGIVIKFTGNGILQWLKIYPTGSLRVLQSVEELPNQGFIITGGNKDLPIDTIKTLLLRIDQSGNIIWEKKYKVFNRPAFGDFIKKLPNEFLLIGGTSDTANVPEKERVYFIRTDTAGNVKFTKFFPYFKQDLYTAAQYINDNRFIISSFAVSQQYPDTSAAKVIIIDTLGTIIASKNFYSPTLLDNQFFSITLAPNRDILLAGYQNVFWRAEDFLVCRVDSMLNGTTIGINNLTSEIPQEFKVSQNYPNPFNNSTIIKLELPKSSYINITLYNTAGQEMKKIINSFINAGIYEINLDMNSEPSGVYFLRIQNENNTFITKKIILIK